MKKNLKILFVVAVVTFFVTGLFVHGANIVHACTSEGTDKYCLLAPIPGLSSSTDNSIDVKEDFGGYVTRMIRIIIGLMAVIAVIMVIFGGIQYMISESGGEKGAGKERIMNAIWGLVLALSSYMILNTINPDLVNIGINIPHGELTDFDDPDAADLTTEKMTVQTTDGGYINGGDVMCDRTTKGTKRVTGGVVAVNISVGGGASKSVNMLIKKGGPWPYDDGRNLSISEDQANLAFPGVTEAFFYNSHSDKNEYKPITILGAGMNFRASITSYGIKINHDPVLMKVGDENVTSVYAMTTASINGLKKLKSDCDAFEGGGCEVWVTGGTECWAHSTHGPKSDGTDLRHNSTTPKFNDFLLKKYGVPVEADGKKYPNGDGGILNEKFGQTSHGTADHIHINFWSGL